MVDLGEPPGNAASESSRRLRRRRRRRTALLVVLLLIGVLVVAFTVEAVRAYLALRGARSDTASLKGDLTRGDFTAAERHARSLATHARTAKRVSDGFLWDAAASIPVLGDNAEAVQVMAAALDHVAGRPLEGSVGLLKELRAGALQPSNAQFDLAAFRRAQPVTDEMAAATTSASHDVHRLSHDGLLPPVGRAVVQVQQQLDSISGAARSARAATILLPEMLGADGPRNTLLVVQNNAEIRATGGMPGSFSLLQARDGHLTLGFQNTTSDLPPLAAPVLPLTAEEQALFGPTLATDVRDTNLTPDFPRAAELLSAIVGRERGVTFDHVVSVDPVALAAVLKATGPISIGTTELTSANVVASLLNEPYQRLDSQARQDAFFKGAARSIITSLLAGGGNAVDLVQQAARAVDGRHILVWSRHPAEQKLLEESVVSGRLPTTSSGAPQVGIYLNDATAGKIDYYLDTDSSIYSFGCSNGAQRLTARMDLTSSVRTDERLSRFVTGPGTHTARGNIAVNLRIYAPSGGHLTGLTVAGKQTSIAVERHEGREVSVLPLVLGPRDHISVLASFRAGPGEDGRAVLSTTPGIRFKPAQVRAARGC